MTTPIRARVLAAGTIPEAEWRGDRFGNDPRWVVVDRRTFDTPPRVLLELSEADARRLAGRLGEEIELEIRP